VGLDQLSSREAAYSFLHRAFGQAGSFGYHLVADPDGALLAAFRFAPEMEVHEKGGGRAIVTDEVAHQHVEYIVIDSYHFRDYSSMHYCKE
jgi:hypothetical protein